MDGLAVTSGDTLVNLVGVENLTVESGGGADEISLTGTSVTGSLILRGQADDDVITLDYPITTGTLSVDGGTGTADQLDVNLPIGPDTDTLTLDATTIQVVGQTTAAYSNFDALNLNTDAGADDVTVNGTHTGTTSLDTGTGNDTVTIRASSGLLSIDTGADDDTVTVSSATAALDGIGADVSINGGTGSNSLNVDSSGAPASVVGDLTSTQVTGLGMTGAITYALVDNLNLTLSYFGDTFTIISTLDDANTVVNARGEADTIGVGAVNGPTTINAGDGSDTVNVTPSADGPVDSTYASPSDSFAINGLLTVNGGGALGDQGPSAACS